MISYSFEKQKSHLIDEAAFFVDPLGLEPRMTIPKTVVLPLHHESFVTSEESNLIPVGSPYTLTSALVNVLPDLVVGFLI